MLDKKIVRDLIAGGASPEELYEKMACEIALIANEINQKKKEKEEALASLTDLFNEVANKYYGAKDNIYEKESLDMFLQCITSGLYEWLLEKID